ncbi:MAG TPA: RNA polymerase sigma factor SigZ [Candidatus Nanopelagicales bacterium]|nr:RNA polymerase sigma factor SigZ [Candidatus Nanopelagicales bacterium]
MSNAAVALAPPTWESLRKELVGFVRSRVGDGAAADDIVHDVLLRALRELEGPEPPTHLRSWLYRVTRNAIVDHHRARRPSEELPEEIGASPAEDEASAEEELARCMAPLLGTLAPDYREALTLAEVDGLTQREIAERAGLTLSGAKSRVQRARKMLREAIFACCLVEVDRRGGVVGYQSRGGCDACESSGEPSCGDGGRAAGSDPVRKR